MKRGALRVLVTDADCPSGLACVRILGRAGYEVIATGEAAFPPVASSRYCCRYLPIHSPWRNADCFVNDVKKIMMAYAPDIILPVSDAAAYFLGGTEKFAQTGALSLCASQELFALGQSKTITFEKACAAGLPVAEGFVLHSTDPLPDTASIGYPWIVRTDNRCDELGVYKKGETWIVHTAADFQVLRQEQAGTEQSFLVQRYVAGRGAGCFVLFWQGEVVCWHSHERIAEIPWQGGVSARRRLAYDTALLNLSHQLLRDQKPTGLAMIEFRRCVTEGGGENGAIVVEVNARPWGSLALAGHAHIPFFTEWISLLQGGAESGCLACALPSQSPRQRFPVATSLYPGEAQHLFSVFKSFVRREIGVTAALRLVLASVGCVLHPKTKFDYFWIDDWRPALTQSKVAASLIVRRGTTWLTRAAARAVLKVISHVRYQRQRMRAQASVAPAKTLIVCLGNRCRSPFLELTLRTRFKEHGQSFRSAGVCVSNTHVPRRFTKLFERYGFDAKEHRAKAVELKDVDWAECIVVMEAAHAIALAQRFGVAILFKCQLPRTAPRTFSEIPDPYLKNPWDAAQIFESIHRSDVGEVLHVSGAAESGSRVSLP